MALVIFEDFRRSGIDVIGAHSPLVLQALLTVGGVPVSGDVTVEIRGLDPAENETVYTFGMGYVSGSLGIHLFVLDITDIIRKICNEPRLQSDVTSGEWEQECRLVTQIACTIKADGEADDSFTNWYQHGFNQVNDPDGSALVDFAEGNATIPIAIGAPMLFPVWFENVGASLEGKTYRGATLVNTITEAVATVKGLTQVDSPALNVGLYNDYPDQVAEYYLEFKYTATVVGKLNMVGLSEACEGSVLLCWLNRYGTYSYMAFERFPEHRGEQKHIGSTDDYVYQLDGTQGRARSRGYQNVRTVITAVAKRVPGQYFDIIEDLFYSMDVYYYTGTLPNYNHLDADWLRVTVEGQLVQKKKHSHDNVRVDVVLPEKYTHLR